MRTFNERIRPKGSQGWPAYGLFTPEGWSNRLFPGMMTGFSFETSMPSIRMMTIGGVSGKGIVISWGERGKYQIFFSGSEEGKLYKSVYSRAGRFELSFYGEIESIRTIRCSEASLHGDTKQLRQLRGLQVLELQGTSVKVRVEDFSGLGLRELVVCCSEVAGSMAGLADLVDMEVLRLVDVGGFTGDIGVIAGMPNLRRLELRGCGGLWYSQRDLPTEWVAPVIDVSDNGLSAAEVDRFLNDLANTYVYDGRLDIAGNNAAHTAASDEALLMLQALRWELVYHGAEPVLPEFAIRSFSFLMADNPVLTEDVTGLVTGNRIKITLPNNTPVTALIPRITLTDGATVMPESGIAQDFTQSLT